MFGLLRPVGVALALAVVLQAASAVLMLAPLFGMSTLAQLLLSEAADRVAIWRLILLSAMGLGAGLALRGAAELISHLADNTLSLRLRLEVARRISLAPLDSLSRMGSGRVKQVMEDDVAALHHLVAHALLDFANAAATVLAVCGYLFALDWRLALALVPPLLLFFLLYRRVLIACSAERMVAYGVALGRVNQSVVEFVAGMPSVRMFGDPARAHLSYREAIDAFQTFYTGWVRPLLWPESAATLALASITLLLLVATCGFALVQWAGMEPVLILPFALLGPGLTSPINRLMAGAQALQMSRGARSRLAELYSLPQERAPEFPLLPNGGGVRFENVSFSYNGSAPVLTGIDLELVPGRVTALVGRSGSGKSTLARLLLRFHEPQEGRITLGGADLARIPAEALYRHVGFVFQDTHLLRASVRENIALGRPDATREAVEDAARGASIHRPILQLPRGYEAICGEEVNFSGGEAQRIGIARSLLHAPEILLLDEPTAHVDRDAAAEIRQALAALMAGTTGRTVLIISHDLESVAGADAIVVLEAGRIVESGAHAELLARQGMYARMWALQHPAAPAAEAIP
jgi:ATP-binding cassette subfamily B protein